MISLALELGWSIHDVRTYMTQREIQLWRAYSEIEPFGEVRRDLRIGHAAANLAACFTGGRHKVRDFIPDFDRSRQQTVEEMQSRMRPVLKTVKKEDDNG